MEKQTLILDHQQICQKIKRIAYEIYENHYLEEKIFLAGIATGGFQIATLIKKELADIASFSVVLMQIELDKGSATAESVGFDQEITQVSGYSIIIVDDVMNTGKTLIHSLIPLMKIPVKKIQTAVLVNRGHKTFPIFADFKGIELSTTLEEHIQVVLEENNFHAFLH